MCQQCLCYCIGLNQKSFSKDPDGTSGTLISFCADFPELCQEILLFPIVVAVSAAHY